MPFNLGLGRVLITFVVIYWKLVCLLFILFAPIHSTKS